MGRVSRSRWKANVKSMEIVNKDPSEVTGEEIEYLKENYTSTGGLLPKGFHGGAFFTPTHVAKFIVNCLQIKPGSKVLEPSCGSGVFLEHIPQNCEITALELDETSGKVAQLIYPHVNVIIGDALTHDKRDYYDYVIGNPPFGESIQIDAEGSDFTTLSKSKSKLKGKSENAFIELAIKATKPGGYIAFILPFGIAFSQASKKIRELMYDTCWQVATIKLPEETFAHVGTTIATQIIILRKITPNAKKIKAVTKRWGSNFRRSDWGDIDEFNAEFFEGQQPAYFAVVTDIGYDKKGNPTNKYDDGKTQLDELIEDFTDNYLVRKNLYPHIPSWHDLKDIKSFFFSHGNDSCDGYRDASLTYNDGPYRWNELTLGTGKEVVWTKLDGTEEERSTNDFTWQDDIVNDYYENIEKERA